MTKILVLYVFHIYNDRVKYFINNAIFYDKNIDFIVISNDKTNKFDVPSYVKKIFRDNIGYDFGGWSDALLINNLYKKYKYFIFVNSSVIGPFLKPNYKGKWTDIFIDRLNNKIKLFGTTINSCQGKGIYDPDPKDLAHVQSYVFSMNKNTLEYLIKCKIFSLSNHAKTFKDAIINKEILMSRKIIEKKWNIGSLLIGYTNVDFTFSKSEPINYNTNFYGDIMYRKYQNVLWDKYDLVFIKGNRDLDPTI